MNRSAWRTPSAPSWPAPLADGPKRGLYRSKSARRRWLLFFPRLWGKRGEEGGVVVGAGEEVGATDLEAQGVGRAGIEAEVVGVARAEALVVDEHPHPRVLDGPGDRLLDPAGFVFAGDRPLGHRHRFALPLLARVEAVEVFPDRILRVEVGPDPVDPAPPRPVVAGEVAFDPRRAAGQRAPDDAHRRRRQGRRRWPFGP